MKKSYGVYRLYDGKITGWIHFDRKTGLRRLVDQYEATLFTKPQAYRHARELNAGVAQFKAHGAYGVEVIR